MAWSSPDKAKKYNQNYYKEHKEYYKKHHSQWYKQNKEFADNLIKVWRRENPEKVKMSHRKTKYGLDQNSYNKIFLGQQGKCEICKKPFTKTPHVDHSHQTNKVRGLLCRSCNTTLGFIQRESGTWLSNAITYLDNKGF